MNFKAKDDLYFLNSWNTLLSNYKLLEKNKVIYQRDLIILFTKEFLQNKKIHFHLNL